MFQNSAYSTCQITFKSFAMFLFNPQSDLTTRPVEKEVIDKMCRENAFLGWTEMSVKEDVNVTETME